MSWPEGLWILINSIGEVFIRDLRLNSNYNKKNTYQCIVLIIKSNCHGIDILDSLYFFTKDTIDLIFLMSVKEVYIENSV